MPMPKNKCYGCTDRQVGCQMNCESYITYAAECSRIRNNRQNDSIWNGYRKQCSDKATRIHFGKASY